VRVSWIDPLELIEHEFKQLKEEGQSVAALHQRWEAAKTSATAADAMRSLARLMLDELAAPMSTSMDDPIEPSSLEKILHTCTLPQNPKSGARIASSLLADRIAGGWFGRAAGCLLGKPVEKTPRAGIKELLESNGSWPLSSFITEKGIPAELLKKYPWNRHEGRESLRENIVCMTEDDDMNYPMLNLSVLESAGREFTTEQIASAWLTTLPVLSTFTAERVAYLNLLEGLEPPITAIHHNPYREWIGAQIRGDVFGWIAPGDPRMAASLAYRDARLSHVRNGIYGEMFVAAMIAAAFVCNDPRAVVETALQVVPPKSRFSEAVRFALTLPSQESSWEATVDRLEQRYGHYHWVHTINNAALVVAALLYGNGDYGRSICNVVMGGWDTDSNGATVGSVVGTMLGKSKLPDSWLAPLNNRIRSSLKGFDNMALDQLAEQTVRVAERPL
jgi:ADP-ribosylglycohydrolase